MVKKRSCGNKMSFTIAFILGGLFLFCLGYFFGQKGVRTISSTKLSDTKKSYCNDIFNFCFQYPAFYELEEKDLLNENFPHVYDIRFNHLEKKSGLDNSKDIRLLVFENINNLTLEKWYKENHKEKYLTVPFANPKINTNFNEHPTILVIDNEAPGVPPSISTFVKKDRFVFELESMSFEDTSKVLDYMQILSSFKF